MRRPSRPPTSRRWRSRALPRGCPARGSCPWGAARRPRSPPVRGAAPGSGGPGEPLPFADGEFELVLCAETIEHVRDVQLFLSEVRRVLRPGGGLAVTTPSHDRMSALRLLVSGFESGFDPLSPHLRFFTRR